MQETYKSESLTRVSASLNGSSSSSALSSYNPLRSSSGRTSLSKRLRIPQASNDLTTMPGLSCSSSMAVEIQVSASGCWRAAQGCSQTSSDEHTT